MITESESSIVTHRERHTHNGKLGNLSLQAICNNSRSIEGNERRHVWQAHSLIDLSLLNFLLEEMGNYSHQSRK
jgi:hypothetical protein